MGDCAGLLTKQGHMDSHGDSQEQKYHMLSCTFDPDCSRARDHGVAYYVHHNANMLWNKLDC